MPADRKSAPRQGAGRSSNVTGPSEPVEPEAESVEPEPEAEPVPLNRAKRRGRAKRGSKPPAAGRGKVDRQHGPVQSQRLWSNRRGGS